VIVQESRAAEHPVQVPVGTDEVIGRHLADPIRVARQERGRLTLWPDLWATEHLAGTSEVNPALRLELKKGCHQVVRTADVALQCLVAIGKALPDKAGSGQVVALVKLDFGNGSIQPREVVEADRVEDAAFVKVTNAPRLAVALDLFQTRLADKAMDLVAER